MEELEAPVGVCWRLEWAGLRRRPLLGLEGQGSEEEKRARGAGRSGRGCIRGGGIDTVIVVMHGATHTHVGKQTHMYTCTHKHMQTHLRLAVWQCGEFAQCDDDDVVVKHVRQAVVCRHHCTLLEAAHGRLHHSLLNAILKHVGESGNGCPPPPPRHSTRTIN